MPNDPSLKNTGLSSNLDILIRAEQIRFIYNNTPMMVANNIMIPALLAYVW